MKSLAILVGASALAVLSALASAQSPPPLPSLDATQAQQVQQQMDLYRREVDARVARGDLTPDEAQRLLRWREWQIAQQAAGLVATAPPLPPDYAPPMTAVVPPRPYYGYPYYGYPAYAPYYVAPAPWWGVSVCAGRAWRNGFGSLCL